MRPSRLPIDQSSVKAEFHSHYEIIDTDLYNYILTMDASAWRRYLHGVIVCPFCGSEVTLTGSCCRRFSEFRQTATGEKPCSQEDVKSKGGKLKGKKFSVMEEAKRRNRDYLANRSVT